MSEQLVFYAVFLSQILLISFYYPRQIVGRMKRLRETHPPSAYPKLYPRPAEYYTRSRRNYWRWNLVVLLLGFSILAALWLFSESGVWAYNIAIGYFFLQLIPALSLDLSFLREFKLMRKVDSRRKASLSPRRLSDFVPPLLGGAALITYLAFVFFVFYVQQFDFPWFGGYWNVVGVTFMNLCFGAILLWSVYGRKLNPHQAYEDRVAQITKLVRILLFISIAATVFVALTVTLAAWELRNLQPIAVSLYFQLLAVISFQAYRIDQANFEVYKEDPLSASPGKGIAG